MEEQQQGMENNAGCDRSPSYTLDDLGNDSLKYIKEETEMVRTTMKFATTSAIGHG